MARSVTRIAHRGYALDAPENTVPAVRAAVDAGEDGGRAADAVEVDVRRCADALVVIHDDTVDRVTDARGPVREFTADELGALDVLGSGAGVPRFAELLAVVPDEVSVTVELKERGCAADAVDAVADAGVDAVLSSFDPGALADARDAAPSVPRALIFDDDPSGHLETALELGCAAVHPELSRCLGGPRALAVAHRWLGRGGPVAAWFERGGRLEQLVGDVERWGAEPASGFDLVERAHAEGLDVNAWTARTPAQARALAARGVDGIAADTAAVFEVP